MNARKSKRLRRQAEEVLFEWYKSLLEEEEANELTLKQAVEYTPTVSYYNITVEKDYKGIRYTQEIVRVSDNTYRWFVLQEKKRGIK